MNKYFNFWGLDGRFNVSMLLLIYATVLAIIFSSVDRTICFIAMLLSSIGDIVLMNFKNLKEKLPINYFFVGAIAFMLAHIVYMLAFVKLINKNEYEYHNIGFYVGMLVVIIGAITVISAMIRQKEKPKKTMLLVCLIYVFVIGLNCVTIFSYAFSVKSIRSIVAIGAISFLISDLMIGFEKLCFVKSKTIRTLIWWFYPIGQILILAGG